MESRHDTPNDAVYEGNPETLACDGLDKGDIKEYHGDEKLSTKVKTGSETMEEQGTLKNKDTDAVCVDKLNKGRGTAKTNLKTQADLNTEEQGSEKRWLDSPNNKGKGISPFLEGNTDEFKLNSDNQSGANLIGDKAPEPDNLKPTKSALLKRDTFTKIKKQKSVVFNKYAKVVEVENWKKYNVDMYKELMKQEQKRSFCALF